MTEVQHTPGPWTIDDYQTVEGPDGFIVAECLILSLRDGAPTDTRCEANARLIAAAPDMLAALLAIVDGPHDIEGGLLEEHETMARSAIAKATKV